MSHLPSITSSWRFRVNIATAEADAATHRQRLLFEIARSWLWLGTGWTDSAGASANMSSPPWRVDTSSDGVAYEGTNRWEDLGDLVWASDGVAHSCMQLVHPTYFGADAPLYVLFDCTEDSALANATLGIYVSRTGFGEGSVTTRPTAADEIEIKPTDGTLANAAWQGGTTGVEDDDRTGRLHFMMSSDGRFVRVIICRLGVCVAFWDLVYDENYDEDTEWTHPVAMAVISNDSAAEVLDYDNLGTETWARYVSRDDTNVAGVFYLVMEMVVVGTTRVVDMPAITMGGYSGLHPIGLAAVAPASGAGASIMRDAWWGRTALAGQSMPSDASAQFTQFGIIMVPWNRSVALFA